ncbi:Beige/BEACH domain containing protein [Tritrichomonas foetus]|uniref:Beige/BEACH domain containing protein n=1 Tax=Tritrichomonas foetus TaxID=1144522 RepID=A0A1J4JQG1_9EUKA|nr:Beige/BEACH domain containing protein [Tritrichomonas foetus]|eukprot:OHS99755.1 Beige/BEACH domain containing protein [Tritrichomonas foetus]
MIFATRFFIAKKRTPELLTFKYIESKRYLSNQAMRGLFQRKRQIHDPIIRTWVKWYTLEVPRKDTQLSNFPELPHILAQIPDHEFTRQDINQESKLPEDQFFAQLFELEQPIVPDNPYDQLTHFLGANFQSFSRLDKEVIIITRAFLFRYLIHYMYQLPRIYSAVVAESDPTSQIILVNIQPLLQFLLNIPEHLEDVLQLSTPLFKLLHGFFHNDSRSAKDNEVINKFNSQILGLFLNFTSSITTVNDVYMPIFDFYIEYYQFWVMKYGSLNFVNHFLNDCTNIPRDFVKFPIEFAQRHYKDIITPMLQIGMNLLSFIYLHIDSNNSDEDTFKLGISFLNFLKFVAELGPAYAEAVWKHQMFHLIVTFTIWAIDHFNFASFEITTTFDETEMSLISSDFQKSLQIIDPPIYEFITDKTFPSHLVINIHRDPLNDRDQLTQYAILGVHDMVASKNNLKELMNILRSFANFNSSEIFLSIFADVSLHFAQSYLEDNPEMVKPLSNHILLATEITFFTIQLLSNVPIDRVSHALASIDGFKLLLSNYAFAPQHNMWTSRSESEDLGFFCLIRNSIFKLLCNCFVNAPKNAPDVLIALGEIFNNSSPQMADEANKLLSILFKSNPSAFLQAVPATDLVDIIVRYQMRLQSMQLKLIEDHIDPKFVGFVGQSRVQILHLIDLFLLHDPTRCYLFCSSHFVKMLFHLLFEPMTQEFVLDLIKRGLQLDSGSFDKKMVCTPFDNLFPNIQAFFKESLKHKDDVQWINLILIFLKTMCQILVINRQSVLNHIIEYNFMEDASQLPSIATELDAHMNIVNCVLKCYIPILQANVEMQKRAARFAMKTICREICGLPFGNETIDIMLEMVFEQPISLSNLPRQAEIHNQKMLPFLHESTKHLEQHTEIFRFIAHICSPSVTNKLKVFRSKMPITILKYIQSFPTQSEITTSQKNSINALLTLFMTVSSFVFQWKTFFESIRSMRSVNKTYRSWWTGLLISCFTNILSSMTHESPSSFFHFDGRHTGISLPPIGCSYFQNGFSFMVRFELGAVWGLPSTKPRLLSLVTSSNQRLELYFEKKRLVCEYQRSDKAQKNCWSPEHNFEPNRWYHLVLTISNAALTFYINGKNAGSFQLKRTLKFDGVIENGRIANITTSKIASSEMPLIVNMSCVYMFSTSLLPETIALMSMLPIDFVYSFSPSPSSMFSEIPPQCFSLFTEANDSNLVFCYNARMTVDNTCANLARNDVANATVRAHIIPFSTSFCDVTTNIGGLKTFLPLFTQVDLPIENEANNDAQNFLLSLIGLFSRFCSSSEMIQSEFINSDGFKCLADLLTTIHPSTFQRRVINQLIEFYKVLNCDEFRTSMAKDFWFNFTLWKHATPEIQKFVISQYKSNIFVDSIKLMINVTSVKAFLLLVYDQENIEIRSEMWKFLMELACLKFTSQDQELFFKFSFIESKGTVLHLEVLSHMYKLMKKKVFNFHKVVENHGFFNEFIPLFESPTEEVRIFALRFMVMLHKHIMSYAIAEPPYTIDVYFLNCIPVFNPHELTPSLWQYMLKIYFANVSLQSAILPFICHLSIFYEVEFVQEFLNDLNKSLKLFNAIDCESLPQCNMWFLWLFHCMNQANRPVVEFGDDDVVIEIFAKVCATVVWHNQNDFGDVFTFLLSLQISKKWDTTLFLRKVLCKTLHFLHEVANESICLSALAEVFNYLFYISNSEPFYVNVQLNSLHDREFIQPLESSTPGNRPLQNLLEAFSQPISALSHHFSARILPNGEWLDRDVALSMVSLIAYSKFSSDASFTFIEGKMKVYELFSFILGYIVRCEETMFEESLKIFNMAFDRMSSLSSDMATSIHLFSSALYRVAIKRPDRRDQFISFATKYKSFFPKSLSAVIEKNDIFLKHFTTEFNELTRDICANYYSLLNDRSSLVTKQVKARLENLRQRVLERNSLLKAPKNDTTFLSSFEEEHVLFTQEVQRQKVLCAKANKRIMRDLSSNGGPWCISGSAEHWKLWQICDTKFRREFMKPNLKFDQHMRASFLRDESTAASANAKYERWLNAQDVAPSNEESSLKDGLDDTDSVKSYSFSTEAQLITIAKPLPYDGTFFMNNHEICFNGNESKSVQFPLSDLEMVLRRSYLHIDSGLEFFLTTKKSYFVYFSKGNRSSVTRLLKSCTNIKVLQTSPGRDVIQQFTERWKCGQLSNYEYLMYLNLIGGRSFNDLSQYPVFPWILSDYTSETIDLSNPKIYRDLSKPIGALNEQRLQKLIRDYEECPDSPYKCLYRVHYSNPFYVVHYLSRIEPFTTSHIEMQSGKFDKANRMFKSIALSYEAVTSLNSDFREIIPEFFTLPDFLVNANHFNLGIDEGTGQSVDDVILPPWAKSAEDFIRIHRQALESAYVSEHLPDWIDLIFGCNQSGQNAIKHFNTFHSYCYQSSVTAEVRSDNQTLQAIQNHINTVGIIPGQLFTMPHPKRQYVPPMPKLFFTKSPAMRELVQLNSAPRFSTVSGSTMFFLTKDLKFCSLTIPKNLKTSQTLQLNYQQIGSIDRFLIVPSNSSVTPSKSYAYLPSGGHFVSSSVWDNSFHVFRVEQTSLTHVFSQRQKHSLIANLSYAGGTFLLTSWRDSSLTLWNLKSPQQMPLYRVTPHLTSLVDIDANPTLRLIASLDKSRKLILSYLPTGRYIRAFDVKGNDELNKLMLLSNGYIVVASEFETSDRSSITTIIRVFGINTNQIAEVEFDGQMLLWCRAELDSGFDGIGLIFKNKQFVFLEIPTLKKIFQRNLPQKTIVSLNCIPQYLVFVLTDADGTVFYVDLE